MPYVLLICGKININIHTVQYAKTRIFISKFRSFFLQESTCFSTCFPKNHSRRQPLGCCDMVMIVEIWCKALLCTLRLLSLIDRRLASCDVQRRKPMVLVFYHFTQHPTPNTQLIGLFGANIGQGGKQKEPKWFF